MPLKWAKNPHQFPPPHHQRAQAQRRGEKEKKRQKPTKEQRSQQGKKEKKRGGKKKGGGKKKRRQKIGLKKSPKGPNQGHKKTRHTPKKGKEKKQAWPLLTASAARGQPCCHSGQGTLSSAVPSCHLTPAAPRPREGQLLHCPALLRKRPESHRGGCHARWPPHAGRVSSLLLSPKQVRVAALQGRPRRSACGRGG